MTLFLFKEPTDWLGSGCRLQHTDVCPLSCKVSDCEVLFKSVPMCHPWPAWWWHTCWLFLRVFFNADQEQIYALPTHRWAQDIFKRVYKLTFISFVSGKRTAGLVLLCSLVLFPNIPDTVYVGLFSSSWGLSPGAVASLSEGRSVFTPSCLELGPTTLFLTTKTWENPNAHKRSSRLYVLYHGMVAYLQQILPLSVNLQ